MLPSIEVNDDGEEVQVGEENGDERINQFTTPEQEIPVIEEPPSTMGQLHCFFNFF